jgi:hypothetical protein
LVLANLAWSVATLPQGLSRKEEGSAFSHITSVYPSCLAYYQCYSQSQNCCTFKGVCMIVPIICMFVCFMQLLCLLPSLASQKPVLRGNTSRASKSQKPSYFQIVHYKFLCMVFQAISSKFSCATFQKPSNTSHFVPLFLAHQDVVDGFVIFHTKLSTP